MKISIDKIIVEKRIRKEINRIEELAADIQEKGLLQPIIVMPLDGGELRLLAGLRRLRAVQSMGWVEIEANVVPPVDAEAALRIEISENEQREPFTFSEKMDFAALLKEIEQAKAKERRAEGNLLGGITAGKGRPKDNSSTDHGPPSYEADKDHKQESRNIIGEKIGMSGRQYDRAKYIADNASPEIIDELDRGERTIRGTYDELRAKEKAAVSPPVPEAEAEPSDVPFKFASPAPAAPPKFEPPKQPKLSDKAKEERAMAMLSPEERETLERNNAFAAMSPEQKIAELQAQLKAERRRAVTAEAELTRLKDELHNAVYHRDGIIKNMTQQLAAAEARVRELEEKYEQDKRE